MLAPIPHPLPCLWVDEDDQGDQCGVGSDDDVQQMVQWVRWAITPFLASDGLMWARPSLVWARLPC